MPGAASPWVGEICAWILRMGASNDIGILKRQFLVETAAETKEIIWPSSGRMVAPTGPVLK